MEIYDFSFLLNSKIKKDEDTIITIGVFDGMHYGHISLIETMMEEKKKYPNASTMLITFSINPKTTNPKNIDTIRLREENTNKLGINSFTVIDFSKDFSETSASGFIKMLTQLCNPVALVVGEDFRFGNSKSSKGAKDLEALFLLYGKRVEVIIKNAILNEGGEKISSTLLRRVIENGDLECFSKYTGQHYRVDLMPYSYIIDKNNLVFCKALFHQLLPPPGVYEARLKVDNILHSILCVIDAEKLIIQMIEENLINLILEKKVMHLDSIYFGEKNDF